MQVAVWVASPEPAIGVFTVSRNLSKRNIGQILDQALAFGSRPESAIMIRSRRVGVPVSRNVISRGIHRRAHHRRSGSSVDLRCALAGPYRTGKSACLVSAWI